MREITQWVYGRSARYIASCRRSAIKYSYEVLVLVACFTLVGTYACSDCDEPTPASLTIEAWLDNDGYPVVILGQALSPSASPTGITEAMVRWGKVTITDGADTIIMTGGMDYSMFPPFSYRTYAVQGQIGRTYTIMAEYEGKRATATSTILPPAEIEEIVFKPVADSLYSGSIRFKAPDTTDTCRYVLYTRVRNRENRHYPSMLGTATTYHPKQEVSMPMFRGKHTNIDAKYEPNFILGDTVDVVLARVEPQVYDFWDAYNNTVYFGNNIFISANSSLPGNVEGGYGIFSARGISRRVVIVK